MVFCCKTYECVLSTDLMDHVPNVADAGKPAAGKYLIMMMSGKLSVVCFLVGNTRHLSCLNKTDGGTRQTAGIVITNQVSLWFLANKCH